MSGQALKTDPLCPQQHTHPKHSPNRCIFCEYGAAVRADALQAARDAVAALIDPEFHWASATIGECGMHAGREQALAAIDALRLNTADCLCPSPNPDCQHPTCPREGK